MPVFRIEKTSDFTVISSKIFRDTRLSYKAKGLLTTMLSCSDSWDYTASGLTALSSDGINSVTTAIKELEKFGYIERRRIRNQKGYFQEIEYIIYEQPINVKPQTEEKTSKKNQSEKQPQTEENQAQYNINQTNINQTNINQSIKDDDVIDGIGLSFNDLVGEICSNIGYEWFKAPERGAKLNEQIEGIVGIIAEVMASNSKVIFISGNRIPAELVRDRFRNLTHEHVKYVLECVNKTQTKITNIKKYLISALYNAPLTMTSYYGAYETATTAHQSTSYDLSDF
ncbi:MAG: DUF6017 domain-containing protein [Clostridia bacterium]